MRESAHCLRCDHKWEVRKEGRPEQCPKCKNPKWDEVRLVPPQLPAGEADAIENSTGSYGGKNV